jgi:hypothetical protein
MSTCLRCSSHNIVVIHDFLLDGKVLDQHSCMDCSFVWWMDNYPTPMKRPEMFVPEREKELAKQVDRLKEIVASQAAVIADYQEMMRSV